MTNLPSKKLRRDADAIYQVIWNAIGDGFKITVNARGFIDLVDEDGNREPLFGALVED